MNSMETYLAWRAAPELDEETRQELAAIEGNPQEIEERFYRDLEFGTAGLRGILGAGTNRMNRYVVRRATQGLADTVAAAPGGSARGVCIAFDSRRGSEPFAVETARVLAANGIKTYLFSTLHSVPQLSFTLQRLHCLAGVVITASHNTKEYNGYKVYWSYGGQAAPEQADAIYRNIQNTPMFAPRLTDFAAAVADGRITMLGESADEAYYAASETLLLYPELVREHGNDIAIVYTPLHGTGNVPVRQLLARVGVQRVTVVPEQEKPDPDFPTVSAPNPENPEAFRLATRLADETRSTVCIATDPDADRLGVAVKTAEGAWRTLTGNQIGCLLLEHILSALKAEGALPEDGVVVKSLVSTRLADAISARYGISCIDVLTGFRFIAEKIDEYARTGEKTFLFGFEESYGFLAGGLARDKDAISSAMLIAELTVLLHLQGKTLSDALESLYQTYGHYGERAKSYALAGKEGLERIASCMERLRAEPPKAFCGSAVASTEDFEAQTAVDASGVRPTGLPRSNVLRYTLENGATMIVRPSGTEPKLKLYLGARETDELSLCALLDALETEADELLRGLLK